MLEYLAKKGKNCPGAGYLITVESSVADTRERPYKIDDVKGDGNVSLKHSTSGLTRKLRQ